MDSEAKDIRGEGIYVGCKVSDGLVGGTVTSVRKDQVWFTVEAYFGKPIRGRVFNRPENLMVINPERWDRVVGK